MRSDVGRCSIVIVSALLVLGLSACGGGASIGPTTVVFLPYWQYRASMPTPRVFLAAAVGLDGRTFVFGGEVNTGTPADASDSVDAYTPATDSWTAGVSQLPTHRRNFAAVTERNGLIYTIGGLDLQTQGGSNAVEAYNPNTNSWTCSTGDLAPGCASSTLVPQPTPGPIVATVGLDGRIDTFAPYEPTHMEVYNPDTNTWTCSMGDAASGCSAMSLAPVPGWYLDGVYAVATGPDGRIYVIAHDVYGGVFKAYDPGSNTWTCSTNDPAPSGCYAKTLAPPPDHGIEGMAAAVAADASIFVIGGFGNTQNPTTKVDAYDTGSNTWSPIAPMNTSRAFAAAVRGSDGYIYAIGGFSPTECDQCHVASVERYVAVRPGLTPTPLHTPLPQVDPTPHCLVCSGAATPTPTHAAPPTPTHAVQPTPTHAVPPTPTHAVPPTPTPTPSCRVVFSGSINTITGATSYLDLATGQTSGSQTGGDDLQWSPLGPAPALDALNGTHLGDLSNYSAASCATLEGLSYPKSTEPATNGETFAARLADGDLAKVQVSLPGTEPSPTLQVVTYAP